MTKALFYFGLIFIVAYIRTSSAVEIKTFEVPSMHILGSEETKPLVLNCEYEISPNETGLVVKWLFNRINFYQWIPNQPPSSLGIMKKHVDLTYSTPSNKYDQHKAISIVDPQWNMTGNYTCSVQTFQGMSEQTSELKIIHRESEFRLNAEKDDEGDDLEVTCSVADIFPAPNLAILINGAQLSIEVTTDKNPNGRFDVEATSKKSLSEIESPTTVTCILSIPGTEYEKHQETVYNAHPEPVEMIDNELVDVQNGDTLSRLESTSVPLNGEGVTLFPVVLLILSLSMGLIINS